MGHAKVISGAIIKSSAPNFTIWMWMQEMDITGKRNIVSRRVRQARKAAHMTQEQLAARMQLHGVPIDQQAISKIEKNERSVCDYELLCLSDVLNVSLVWLVAEAK